MTELDSFEKSRLAFETFKKNNVGDPNMRDVVVGFVDGKLECIGHGLEDTISAIYDRCGNVPMYVNSISGSERVVRLRTPRFIRNKEDPS